MKRNAVAIPDWWDAVLRRVLELPDFDGRTLQRFVPPLEQLSEHLNAVDERSGRPSLYMHKRLLRETYLLYYSTANLLKPLWVLDQLWPEGPPPGPAPLRVLDLGCGPGTGIAALHVWTQRHPEGRPLLVKGIDASEANASLYRQVGDAIGAITGISIPCDVRQGDAARPPGEAASHDLVMALNLLNEIPEKKHAAFLSRCEELLVPGGVLLLVEPALRLTSRVLLRLRDHAVAEGWNVRVPCFRQADCPALVSEKDWCHHDLPWERPQHIAWLDEVVGNVKRSLKFSCLVLRKGGMDVPDTISSEDEGKTAPQAEPQAAPRLRVVSELFVEKGRTWCHCCGEEGRRVYQRNHRDRSGDNADFDRCVRYDTLAVEGAEARLHDVRITAESTVRLLSRSIVDSTNIG
ncbi:MAG: methyltransferase domain-containing protein [Bacteroidetes bacterium]|nr:methyltransferase domain-containing protein [Bacteroidota bacterium]